MHILKTTFAHRRSSALPLPFRLLPQDNVARRTALFVDGYGTSFQFSLCGEGTDLCGVLTNLEGESATQENLAFVGKQVMQAEQVGPNEWKGVAQRRRHQCRGDRDPDRPGHHRHPGLPRCHSVPDADLQPRFVRREASKEDPGLGRGFFVSSRPLRRAP